MLNKKTQMIITIFTIVFIVSNIVPAKENFSECSEKWACSEWSVCYNMEEINKKGYSDKKTYILEKCEEESLNKSNCGFHLRHCKDIENCNTTFDKPEEIKECYYLKNPGCNDNIKNCHNSSCELLVDCGGPCEPCPTCRDGIKNQGETGIDCGGPCNPCSKEREKFSIWEKALMGLISLFLLFYIINKLKKLF